MALWIWVKFRHYWSSFHDEENGQICIPFFNLETWAGILKFFSGLKTNTKG